MKVFPLVDLLTEDEKSKIQDNYVILNPDNPGVSIQGEKVSLSYFLKNAGSEVPFISGNAFEDDKKEPFSYEMI